MTQAEKVLDWAFDQIGTAENPLGSNNVRYNTEYYGHEVSGSAYPWCMAFIWCGFHETGLSKLFYGGKKTASCTTLMKWAANKGYFVTGDYQKGDVFLYDWDANPADSEHTGFFTGGIDSIGRYIAIEGNYGNKVARVLRAPKSIIGAFRPQWSDAKPDESGEDIVAVKLQEISRGDKGEQVKSMQILLIGRGYSCGQYGADGEYGSDTYKALTKFQSDKGLEVDGICGANTWSKLLKG